MNGIFFQFKKMNDVFFQFKKNQKVLPELSPLRDKRSPIDG
jgi:hypothetical protein